MNAQRVPCNFRPSLIWNLREPIVTSGKPGQSDDDDSRILSSSSLGLAWSSRRTVRPKLQRSPPWSILRLFLTKHLHLKRAVDIYSANHLPTVIVYSYAAGRAQAYRVIIIIKHVRMLLCVCLWPSVPGIFSDTSLRKYNIFICISKLNLYLGLMVRTDWAGVSLFTTAGK